MKSISLLCLLLLGLPVMAQRSVLYDTSTYRLILPTNILGMTFNGTLVTNMAGTGLTISSGVLQVNTGVMATLAAVSAGYQPLDATLTAFAGASTGSDTLVYFSAADTASVTTFTTFGRSLVDDANAPDARTTLGLVIGTHVQAWDTDLDDLADGTLSGSKIGTGIDAGNITAGTLAEARIDAAIARVSALSAYAGLSISNSFTATNTFAAIDLGGTIRTTWPSAGGGDIYAASNNVFTASNTFSGPINFGGESRTNWPSGADTKLDDLATPDDNTDLDASTLRHGLLPKLGGGTNNFLRADGTWAAPAGGADARYLLLEFGSASDNPTDAATRYISVIQGLPPRTAASNGPMVVPVDGTVIGYHVSTHINAGGGSELINFYLRHNDTTDFGNATIAWDANYKELVVSGLSQAVSAGDKLIVKMVYPTWVTDPTTVRHFGWVLMEAD